MKTYHHTGILFVCFKDYEKNNFFSINLMAKSCLNYSWQACKKKQFECLNCFNCKYNGKITVKYYVERKNFFFYLKVQSYIITGLVSNFFYAPCNRVTSSLQKRNHHKVISRSIFEDVCEDKIDVCLEIKSRVTLANRCYNGLNKQLSSRDLSRTTKLILYKTLILPVLLYGAEEVWTLLSADAAAFTVFERNFIHEWWNFQKDRFLKASQ